MYVVIQDHAMDHTAENAYFGQAGFYILHDPEELAVVFHPDNTTSHSH
jgi:hypothetical protein